MFGGHQCFGKISNEELIRIYEMHSLIFQRLYSYNKYIYKMRSSAKSFANQFGITQKNLSNNPSQGIGLNPNLNIEDEYIQNLLKQVHFLNMEIKLVKQKQKQNKGMGIMGLLNKDTNPVVTHAISSNDKFSQMKNKLDNVVNTAEVQNLRLEDQNFAVKAQRDFLERLNLKQQQKNIQNKIYVEKQLTEGIDKLRSNQSKLQQLRAQAKRTSDMHTRLKQQLEQFDIKDRSKQLLKTILQNLEGQTFQLTSKHHTNNETTHIKHKNTLEEADRKFREDPKYIELTQENTKLKQHVKKTDRDLFDINYRVKEMEELKKLSIRNKDVEGELKKQAAEEMERLKKKLNDKKTDLETKVTENKNGLESNDEIRLMKGKIARKDKQTNDIKRKTEISQTNYKKLRDEVMKLGLELEARKKLNSQKHQLIGKNAAILNAVEAEMRNSELDYEKADSELKNAEGELRDVRRRLEQLQEENAYLGAKQQHLNKSIDMDQGIRKVKIEQLTNLIQSNLGLNSTISDLMSKWEQIIRFSREPPA